MISAMPAVAIRRERKKPKSVRSTGPPSHHSSLTSLARGRSFQKRSANQSISTISSTHGVLTRRRGDGLEAQRQKRRFLIYLGTILLITGLLLVFIGVGANIANIQRVGLLFIGVGSLLCLIKVFFSQSQETREVKKKAHVPAESNSVSVENVNGSNATLAPPNADGPEFTAIPVHTISPNQDSNTTSNSNQNSSLTPSSLNSIPETQVLIAKAAERF